MRKCTSYDGECRAYSKPIPQSSSSLARTLARLRVCTDIVWVYYVYLYARLLASRPSMRQIYSELCTHMTAITRAVFHFHENLSFTPYSCFLDYKICFSGLKRINRRVFLCCILVWPFQSFNFNSEFIYSRVILYIQHTIITHEMYK